jgi:serine/threonine protein kinase
MNVETGEKVALKQFPKQGSKGIDSTAQAEVNFGRMLFPRMPGNGGRIAYGLDPGFYPGIKSIARLLDEIEDSKDFWLVYEVGSASLNKHLFDVKGEFYKGERLYLVNHSAPFYTHLKQHKALLRSLIRKLVEVFRVLSELKIVHADIKPDNILLAYDPDRREITDLKLIDLGSAFSFDCPSNIQASTPEYLAPEVLEYLENRAQNTQVNGTNSENLCRVQ